MAVIDNPVDIIVSLNKKLDFSLLNPDDLMNVEI